MKGHAQILRVHFDGHVHAWDQRPVTLTATSAVQNWAAPYPGRLYSDFVRLVLPVLDLK